MAKKSKIARNLQRKELVDRYAAKRKALKAIVADPNQPEEKKAEAVVKLQQLPRDSSRTRVRNRCRVTGRPRGFYRKFEISRVALRDLGNRGEIAGLTKASW
ncbi:MAG TPA: 30S ribosomal protein S14 [Myxococcales bacterium LLY-WYZ-16_1]|nr:30S ribosomal protein S14 [Myxococcales bacterium LLY-WYZ-16_1]